MEIIDAEIHLRERIDGLLEFRFILLPFSLRSEG